MTRPPRRRRPAVAWDLPADPERDRQEGLFYAVRDGRLDDVRTWLAQGAALDQPERFRHRLGSSVATAVEKIVENRPDHRSVAILRLLLDRPVSPEVLLEAGLIACKRGATVALEMLWGKTPEPFRVERSHLWISAALQGAKSISELPFQRAPAAEVLAWLLERGARLPLPNPEARAWVGPEFLVSAAQDLGSVSLPSTVRPRVEACVDVMLKHGVALGAATDAEAQATVARLVTHACSRAPALDDWLTSLAASPPAHAAVLAAQAQLAPADWAAYRQAHAEHALGPAPAASVPRRLTPRL